MGLVKLVDFSEEYEKPGPMRLFVFRKAGMMDPSEHGFSDDVAITYAKNLKWAIRHFRQAYAFADKTTVFEVRFNADGLAILTNY